MNNIPMVNLAREYEFLKDDIDAAIHKCLEHQKWILGPEVTAFEQQCSQYLSAQHCIGTASGTNALVVALRALAIQKTGNEYFSKDDKIITTPFTFSATGETILRSGATPVFVDIDPKTFNIDPERIQKCMESTKGIIGIVPVHLYGQPCDMERIMAIAKEHDVFVVEDTAQAFGAECKGNKVGTIGDLGTFSFFPAKNLGGFGDGGLISTHNGKLADIARQLINHGGKNKNDVKHIGYNGRLDTIQAAVLSVKLARINDLNQKRKDVAQKYQQALAGHDAIKTLNADAHVYHQYTIQVSNGKRDLLQKSLNDAGIASAIHYAKILPQMELFQSNSLTVDNLDCALNASKNALCLPIGPFLNDDEIKRITHTLMQGLN